MERDIKLGEKSVLISSFLTLLSSLLKLVGGYITRTGALIADGIHSLSDTIQNFASYFGIKLIQKEPTEKFPYGLYKVENLITLFLGIFILFGAYELIKEGLENFNEITDASLVFSIIGLFFSVLIFIIQYYGAKKSKSESLKVIALESMIDIAISVTVFLIILFRLTEYQYPFTVMISMFMIVLSLRILYDSILALLDVSPSREVLDKVREIILNINGVKKVKDIKLRKAGPFIIGEVTIETLPGIPVERAHEISEEIEERVEEIISHIVVHIEPHREKRVIALPILNGKIAKSFAAAEKFLIFDGKRKFFIENPYAQKGIRRGVAVARFLKNFGVDTVIVREIGTISFHSLRDLLIEIYKTDGEDPEKEIKNFFEGKLKRLEKETRERL